MKKTFLFLSIFLTSTFINAQESGETGAIEKYADIIHEKYSGTHPNSEEIESFDWDDVIPDVTESKTHPNGFDGLPKDCYSSNPPANCYNQDDKIVKEDEKTLDEKKIPIIYISIELGKTAKFLFEEGNTTKKLPPYEDLCLLQEKKYSPTKNKLEKLYASKDVRDNNITKDGIDLSDKTEKTCKNIKKLPIDIINDSGTKEISIKVDKFEDGGLFTLLGKINVRKSKKKTKDTWMDILKIRIIPYEPEIKEFVFVEFDGSDKDRKEWDPLEKEPKNSITEKSVLNYFNKVYKQAAAKARITIGKDETGKDITIDENTNINEIDMSKKFKINNIDLVEVYMTENFLSPDRNLMVNEAIEYFAKYGDPKNKKSKYFHIVFAINKEKKTWKLENCIDKETHKIDLTSCNGFNPESEPDYVEYYITEENCFDKEESTSTESLEEINVSKKTVKIQKKGKHYYAIKDGEAQTFKGCENLHTDNGYPILLGNDAKAGGVSRHWDIQLLSEVARRKGSTKLTNNDVEYKEHLPYGSFIFVKRSTGERGQYTVAHELGHSFGLTDVAVNHSEKTKTQLSAKEAALVTRTGKKPPLSGTTETNLMTVMDISGPKIRYRDTPIACTMGKQVRLHIKFKYVKYNSKLERCKDEKTSDCKDDTFTTLERCKDEKASDCQENTFTTYVQVKTQAKDTHENQWECFRNCYREQLISSNRYKWWWANVPNIPDLGKTKGGKNECYINEDSIEDIDFKKIVDSKISLKEIIDEYNPPLLVLKIYYPLKELKKFFSIEELVQALYTPKELEKAGCSLPDFVHLYSKEVLMKYYKEEELKPYDYLWEED